MQEITTEMTVYSQMIMNMVALECLFITFYTIILIPEPSSAAFAYTMKFEVKMPNIAIDPEDHRGPKKTKSKREKHCD
jgi:hypothetical protein